MSYTKNDIKKLEEDIDDYKLVLKNLKVDVSVLIKLILTFGLTLLLHGALMQLVVFIANILPYAIGTPIAYLFASFYGLLQGFLFLFGCSIVPSCETSRYMDIEEYHMYLISITLCPILALVTTLKVVFLDIPTSIYSLIMLVVDNIKLYVGKKHVKDYSNTNELEEKLQAKPEIEKEKEETLQSKPEMKEEKEAVKQKSFEDKIADDLKTLFEVCKLIEGKRSIEFLDRLKRISTDYKTRYKNISYNMNSKVIDLESDNYEKLKGDICEEISVIGLEMREVLEAQTKVNKVDSEIDDVIEDIELYKKEYEEKLVLRR